MKGTYTVTMGAHGHIEVPESVRERAGLHEGATLVLLETSNGIVLLTRDQLLERVRRELEGLDLVGDLLTERRVAGEHEAA